MKLSKWQMLIVLAALAVLLLGAATSPLVYALLLIGARVVLLTYSAQRGVELIGGAARDLMAFLSGLGGLLYILGIAAELLGLANINGRDLDFLVRAVGIAFMVLPLAVAGLPRRARLALGLVC
ncbi:hypothetical protein ACFFLM_21305 [Deinococcus oregonensis]|uniref:Uncharacterized protein n=1 Tax=Deinococcus oregonensis TaxID=1805970 RepID=A0ABV6B409_9DEIO